IVRTAEEEYGISRDNLIVDALTMTVSSSPDAAEVTLKALSMIRQKLGVKTILGVSNVSFGLPRREIINSAFFLLALQAGLDAAIINPASEPMMQSLFAYRVLSQKYAQCTQYIERYSQTTAAAPAPAVTAGSMT